MIGYTVKTLASISRLQFTNTSNHQIRNIVNKQKKAKNPRKRLILYKGGGSLSETTSLALTSCSLGIHALLLLRVCLLPLR
jgi:hypothetical protein